MIVYEVNLRVDEDCAEAYRAWLVPHIQEILALPGFESAEIFEVDGEEEGRKGFCVQYRVSSRAALDDYLENHAPRMRADGEKNFGGRFAAARRVLELQESFKP
jgi:hypothetical protein